MLQVLASHPRGTHKARRASRLVLSQLSQTNSVVGTNKQWQDMGSSVDVNARAVLEKGAALHLNLLKEAFATAETVEMSFDASRYGKYNHELFVCRSPEAVCSEHVGVEKGLASYLPPIPLQELLWRDSKPTDPLQTEDLEHLDAHGIRPLAGASTKLMLRVLNHELHFLGLTLASFKSLQNFRRLPAGWVRYWCDQRRCWIRASDAID